MTQHTDVLIIGGGIAGIGATARLAKTAKVIVSDVSGYWVNLCNVKVGFGR